MMIFQLKQKKISFGLETEEGLWDTFPSASARFLFSRNNEIDVRVQMVIAIGKARLRRRFALHEGGYRRGRACVGVDSTIASAIVFDIFRKYTLIRNIVKRNFASPKVSFH